MTAPRNNCESLTSESVRLTTEPTLDITSQTVLTLRFAVSWMGVTSGMSSTLPKLYDTTVPTEVTTNKCVRFYTGKLTPLIVVTSVILYVLE